MHSAGGLRRRIYSLELGREFAYSSLLPRRERRRSLGVVAVSLLWPRGSLGNILGCCVHSETILVRIYRPKVRLAKTYSLVQSSRWRARWPFTRIQAAARS